MGQNDVLSEKNNFESSCARSDSGRTMVELLGVLAIIGILTITSILGIHFAFNAHKANSIINEVNHRVVVWATNKSLGQPLETLSTDALGYTWSVQDYQDYIELTIVGIEKDVCPKVKRSDWKTVYVNANCSIFSFKSDLSPGTETKECGPCAQLNPVSGHCEDNDDLCGPEQTCDNGYCSSCEHGSWYNSSIEDCQTCNSGGTASKTVASPEECARCSGSRFRNKSGYCLPCTRTDWSLSNTETAEGCLSCPNRVWSSVWYSGDRCHYCHPTYGVQNEDRSDCLPNPNQSCPDGQFFGYGKCNNCGESVPHSTREECLKCKGQNFLISSYSNRCQTGLTDFRNWDGAYYSDCVAAPNRYFVGNTATRGKCAYCMGTVTNMGRECTNTCPSVDGVSYTFVPHLSNQSRSLCCPEGFSCSSSECPEGTQLDTSVHINYCIPIPEDA